MGAPVVDVGLCCCCLWGLFSMVWPFNFLQVRATVGKLMSSAGVGEESNTVDTVHCYIISHWHEVGHHNSKRCFAGVALMHTVYLYSTVMWS